MWFDNLKILVSHGSALGVEGKTNLQCHAELVSASPNPFTSSASIKYSVATTSWVDLKIYNLAGQLVKTLVDEKCKPGTYVIRWAGEDDNEKLLQSGIYFIKLKVEDFSQIEAKRKFRLSRSNRGFIGTKKLLLLR